MTFHATETNSLSGKSLASTIRTMAVLGAIGQDVLDKYGIHEVDPNAWYPNSLRREIHQTAFERFGEESLFCFGLNSGDYYLEAQIAFRKSVEAYEQLIQEFGETAHPKALHQFLGEFAVTHAKAIRESAFNPPPSFGVEVIHLHDQCFDYHINSRSEPLHEAFMRGILETGFTGWLGKYWSQRIAYQPQMTVKHADHTHMVWRVDFTRNDGTKLSSERLAELHFKAREALMGKVLADAESQRRLARKAMDDLESSHRLVLDSIRYASLLQQAQLPRPIRLENRFEDIAVHWEPRDTIGGDLWWISHSSQQDKFTVCVADCSGHGVPGAMLALLASTALERIYGNDPHLSPAKGLLQLSQALRRGLNQDQVPMAQSSLQNDGCDAAFVQVDRRAGTLLFAGANIDLIWMPQGGEVQRIVADAVGLGYRGSDPEHLTEHTLHFNSGDRFLITTDGYVDQVGHDHSSDRRRAFGFQRLLQLLRENRAHSLAFNMQALQNNLQTWQGEGLRRDDITLLAVQLQR